MDQSRWLRPRLVLEAALYAYLLSIPFGRGVPPLCRHVLLLVIIVCFAVLHVPLRGKQAQVPPHRLLLVFAVFALSHVLSIALSTDVAFSLVASVYAPIAALAFLVSQDVTITPEAYRRISLTFTVILVLLSIDGAYQALTGFSLLTGQDTYAARVRGGIPHPNDIALIPLLAPFVLAVVAERRSRLLTALMGACLPLTIVALIASASRNAWLGLAVATAAWVFFSGSWRLGGSVLAGAFILFAVAFALDLGDVRDRLATVVNPYREGRIGLWFVAGKMFVEAPLFGKGVHVFELFYPEYLSHVSLPDGYRPEVGRIPWAHNIYLEFLAERGLAGFIAFAVLVFAAARRLVTAARVSANRRQRLYAAAVSSSLACFLAMGMFDLTFLKDWVSLMFCILVALSARIGDAFTTEVGQDPSG
jgi:putative inorganic carbon (HCO3(-)) transporter